MIGQVDDREAIPPVNDATWFQTAAGRLPPRVDPRRRLGVLRAGAAAMLLVVFARIVQLEWSQGEQFRREAARPLLIEREAPAARGRILARDGTVLACDREALAVAVHYRWLEQPPDARWLRYTARQSLPRAERNDPERVRAAEEDLRRRREELADRLAALCGLSRAEWDRRARRIQSRVERISESVNRRAEAARQQGDGEPGGAHPQPAAPRGGLADALGRAVREALQPAQPDGSPSQIIVAEQLDYHVMVEDVSLDVAAEIESGPDRYGAARIVRRLKRWYPSGALAAHVLGYLGPIEADRWAEAESRGYDADDRVGRAGVERTYEPWLRGRPGVSVEWIDRTGRLLAAYRPCEPKNGRDVVLSIEPSLQRAAERLLDEALLRGRLAGEGTPPGSGAVVVMDVARGDVLVAAAATRFDPNAFQRDDGAAARLLADPARPLFDRVAQMALPPGSVLKIVTAAALIESGVDPLETRDCRGYLVEPDQQRCAIFVRRGIGHGPVNLVDALAASCNVYFFHHASRLEPERLADTAARFGFGRPTGVDLPGEAAGTIPTPATMPALEGRPWRAGDTLALAIGQGSTTATPLQVACLVAAVANGGKLVVPRVAVRLGPPHADSPNGAVATASGDDTTQSDGDRDLPALRPAPRPVPRLDAELLRPIREGLRRAVDDPRGTARATVRLDEVPIACKTGTAETGGGRPPHAWLAGYLPADRPRYALVVVIEHGGDGAEAAGPIARRLTLEMARLGLLD